MASVVAAHSMAIGVFVAVNMPSVAHLMLTRVITTTSVTLVISSAAVSFIVIVVSFIRASMQVLVGKLCLLRSLSALGLVVISPIVVSSVAAMIVMASLLFLSVGTSLVFVNVMVVVL